MPKLLIGHVVGHHSIVFLIVGNVEIVLVFAIYGELWRSLRCETFRIEVVRISVLLLLEFHHTLDEGELGHTGLAVSLIH